MSSEEKSIRSLSPKLYSHITRELESIHIHPYDIQANGVKKENGIEVIIRFGDGYTHMKSELFSFEAVEKLDESITEFIKLVGEECKRSIIAAYYKMMKM